MNKQFFSKGEPGSKKALPGPLAGTVNNMFTFGGFLLVFSHKLLKRLRRKDPDFTRPYREIIHLFVMIICSKTN
jgi:hypothetical protein